MSLVYPDAERLQAIVSIVTHCLSALPYVTHIDVFGSLARGDADRWSDIDLIVVTRKKADFLRCLQTLHNTKPILHHNPLSQADPNGYHALGCVFVDESVFHCVDLNFFTREEYTKPETTRRFGARRTLYSAHTAVSQKGDSDGEPSTDTQTLTADEQRIAVAIGFTKKNAKKVLRGEEAHDNLKRFARTLTQTMQDYPVDYRVVGGNIGIVAGHYVTIAETLLDTLE